MIVIGIVEQCKAQLFEKQHKSPNFYWIPNNCVKSSKNLFFKKNSESSYMITFLKKIVNRVF
jgi:hypothetical protein